MKGTTVRVTTEQVFFVALLGAGFAAAYHAFSGMDLLHEIGHAIFVTLQGHEVYRITASYISASGYNGMSLYMGTGFAIMVRAIALIWLSSKKANPLIAGWIWSRLMLEWLGWFIGNGGDGSMMEWPEYVLWTGLHVSAFAGFVLAASATMIAMLIKWQPKEIRRAEALADEMMRRAA
jgi:hypothetical protein